MKLMTLAYGIKYFTSAVLVGILLAMLISCNVTVWRSTVVDSPPHARFYLMWIGMGFIAALTWAVTYVDNHGSCR
jgi:putative Ca2+/H+ antiporter (TMEM165/GDT1 family)